MKARRMLLTLLGVSVAIAGCGGGSAKPAASNAGFRQAYLKQLGQLRSTGGELTTALQTAPRQTDAQVQRTFVRLARQARPVVSGLAALHPPARYRADITAMRDWLTRADADLYAVARAAGAHHARAARLATRKLIADSAHVKAADRRLSAALGLVID